jgi:hypothetical protein
LTVARNSADNLYLYDSMITKNINQIPTSEIQNLTYQDIQPSDFLLDEFLIDPLLFDDTT